jgi:hypothetical protein
MFSAMPSLGMVNAMGSAGAATAGMSLASMLGPIGGIAGGAAAIVGGIQAAQQAKAQAMAAEISRRWGDFNQQWQNQQQNFELSQRWRADRTMREDVRRKSLTNQLATQSEIYRQEATQQSVISQRYLDAFGNVNASIETRGGDPSRGTGRILLNQVDQMILKDANALNRNRRIAINNARAGRQSELDRLGFQFEQLPSTYMPSTPISQPDVSGMLAASILSGLGGIGGGLGQLGALSNSPTTSGAY